MPLAMRDKVFITAALTGSGSTQDRSDKVPRSPEQIAAAAKEGLRRSGQMRSRSSITTPTWTGQSGEAGMPRAPAAQRPAQPARVPNSQGQSGGAGSSAEVALAQELVTFLESKDGRAPSSLIIKCVSNLFFCGEHSQRV